MAHKGSNHPMRRLLLLVCACGSTDPMMMRPDAQKQPDAPIGGCQPIGAVGSFYRRTTNPRLVAGTHTYSDSKVDVGISDPDVRWDDAAQTWVAYFHGPHATSFSSPVTQMIRRATTPDFVTWNLDDTPALAANSDSAAWDHVNTETPSVVYNPNAPADRRYLLYYSGAPGKFPFPSYNFDDYSIGVATSADGVTFTRLPASESPHNKDGLVLTGLDAYPGAVGAIVADPEVAFVAGTYHLWFSSFACIGTNCATVHAYGISHATSSDGIHWTVEAAPITTLLRASANITTGGAQPSVIYDDIHCRWELWMTSDASGDTTAQPAVFNNMAGVWHALSTNGTSWNVSFVGTRDLAWMQTADGEHLGLLTGADVAAKQNARYMLYGGLDDQNVPSGFFLPDRSAQGFRPGVMTLDLATRDAPN